MPTSLRPGQPPTSRWRRPWHAATAEMDLGLAKMVEGKTFNEEDGPWEPPMVKNPDLKKTDTPFYLRPLGEEEF